MPRVPSALILAALLGLPSLRAQERGVLRIGGGAAPIENILKPIQAAYEKAKGVQLELHADGPDVALDQLQAGKLDAAAAGLTWEGWQELMRAKGRPVQDPAAFSVHPIGEDVIHLFLWPELAIFKLDPAQVRGLLTGRITNWKEVGGPDLAVVPVLGTKVPGTNKVFLEKVMGGEPFAPGARTAGTSTEVIALISQTPGAIGFGPLSAKENWKVWCPTEAPTAARPILLVTKGDPGPALKELLAFIAGEGRKLIAR